MRRWKSMLLYGAIFLLGLAIGLAGGRLIHKRRFAQIAQNRPAVQRQMMMRHLTRQLQLTQSQQSEIEPIVAAQLNALSVLRERHLPEVQAIFSQTEDEIKPLLRPEQQQKLDQIMQRMQKHGRMRGGRPLPP